MSPNRRQVLKAVGVGVGVGLIGMPSAAEGTDRVFVHPRNGLVGDVLDAVDAIGGTTIRTFDNFSFVVAEIPADQRNQLLSDLRIALIEDDGEVGIPSDWLSSISGILEPGGPTNCDLHPSQQSSWGWERIGAADVSHNGDGVGVAILDTGIQTDHCSLEVAGGRNFTNSLAPHDYDDGHGHGTHVAGVAGALDNDLGVVGVAPGVDLYAVKVLDDQGSGRYSSLVAGIDWCMSNDIEIISMSLGGESSSQSVDEAIERAYAEGHLLLTAAGNEDNERNGTCEEQNMTYPATHEQVIAVSAMNSDDSLASFSSVGPDIELMAPGTDILSTYTRNRYAQASGTSVACPFVSGVAATLWQSVDADEPVNQAVRSMLRSSAEPVLETCEEGYGLVDARAAGDADPIVPGDDSAPGDGGTDDPGDGGNGIGGAGNGMSWFDRLIALFSRFFEWLGRLFRW